MQSRPRRSLSYPRLVAALLLLALSLLVLLPAPTHSFWDLSIAVDERGYWLIPVAIFTAFIGRRPTLTSRLATALSLLATAILLLPLSQAAAIDSHLDSDIDSAFGVDRSSHAPDGRQLSVSELFKITGAAGPTPKTLLYPILDSSATPASTDSLALDFYPSRNRNAPLVVMIHGGSWQSGARTDLPELNSVLASSGYAVATVSYRFAPAHPFPAALEDIRSALRFLHRRSSELGIDTTRTVIAGRSAGGQLALLAAYTSPDPGIRGVIGLYAPADLVWGYEHPSNPRVLNSTEALEAYVGGSPGNAPARYHDASPYNFANARSVPTLLLHGSRDELVSVMQSERLDRRLAQYGVPHFFLELPWATHGCDYFISGPCGQLETRAVQRFLSIVMR